jgi:hypothetical protein
VRYDLVNRVTRTMKDFQNSLNEKIDLTLAGIRISFEKALTLHQAGKDNVEKSLGELSEKLGSIAGIHSELLGYAALLNHDGTNEERGQVLPPGRTS